MSKNQRADLLAKAQGFVDAAKAAGRDLNAAETGEVEALLGQVKGIDTAVSSSKALLEKLSGAANPSFEDEVAGLHGTKAGQPGGSRWAKQVMGQLNTSAGSMGLKSLLSGEVRTPPAVEIAPLPDVPTTLLDLIAREPLDQSHFSYLRQVTRTENADVVADGVLKPTSVYTFQEIEDRARVVAHLSEPFPLRYMSDYSSMMNVIDGEMRQGVIRAVERQVVSGNGTGENFTGILSTTGVIEVGYTADAPTTIRRARTVLQNLGEVPNAWVLNPDDAADIELSRENGATGAFLMNSGAMDVIFGQGIARVTSTAIAKGTALLADWSQLRLQVREQESTMGCTQSSEMFDHNLVKLRAEGRFGLKFLRPQSVAVVDLSGVATL